MERKSGRPRKLKLITIDEALELISDYWDGKIKYSRGTIYNRISDKTLRRHGPFLNALVEESQVREFFCKDFKKTS